MIAVLILNWNNAPDTLECLASVYASEGCKYAVYVVDNGSLDDSLSQLRAAYPQAIYLEMGKNLGFAEGNNRGIQKALADGAEYLFLLNNDAILRKDTLALLQEASERFPNAAALGPKIYYYDAPSTIWYGGGGWDPKTASFYHRDRDLEEGQTEQRSIEATDYVCGCALFLRASLLSSVGLMEPRFFLNWEEIDWCWRMKRAGFECLYVPQALAWHKISRSFIGGKRGPMWYYFYYRNRLFWMERNLPLKEFLRLARRVLWPEWKLLIRQCFGPEAPLARAALVGTKDYLFRKFGSGPAKLFKNKIH